MLNIKNKETYELAKELSKVTGKSMTFAVTEAIRDKLIKEKTASYKKKHKVADELMKIAHRIVKTNQNANQPEGEKNDNR